MGKCKVCGKKGLFLSVDFQGMCKICAKAYWAEKANIAAAETVEFEEQYKKWLSYNDILREKVDLGNDPIVALDLLPKFTEKVELCEKLQTELHDPRYRNRFASKIISSITYHDDFCRRHGIGHLEEWGFSVTTDISTKEYSTEKILANFDKTIYAYKHRWQKAIKSVLDSADFQNTIDNIPAVEVKTSEMVYVKQKVSSLDELIKYSTITAKTSYDKIGSFVVIDVETTGLSSTRDYLLEVAAIKYEDWVPVTKFHTLLNPGIHISEEASEINNITDEMVADAPSFSQIIDSLRSFVGRYNIVGHNLPFDLKFLYRHGYDFTTEKRRYYDTCEIAKKTLKKPKMKWDKEIEEYVVNENYDYDVEDYKLTTLCDFYQIRDNAFAHRALSDALATGILFKKLAENKIDY